MGDVKKNAAGEYDIDWNKREVCRILDEITRGDWRNGDRALGRADFVEVVISTKPGFAMMNPSKQREVARSGGLATNKSEWAHRFIEGDNAAREAGRKGGKACAAKKVGAHAVKEKTP